MQTAGACSRGDPASSGSACAASLRNPSIVATGASTCGRRMPPFALPNASRTQRVSAWSVAGPQRSIGGVPREPRRRFPSAGIGHSRPAARDEPSPCTHFVLPRFPTRDAFRFPDRGFATAPARRFGGRIVPPPSESVASSSSFWTLLESLAMRAVSHAVVRQPLRRPREPLPRCPRSTHPACRLSSPGNEGAGGEFPPASLALETSSNDLRPVTDRLGHRDRGTERSE